MGQAPPLTRGLSQSADAPPLQRGGSGAQQNTEAGRAAAANGASDALSVATYLSAFQAAAGSAAQEESAQNAVRAFVGAAVAGPGQVWLSQFFPYHCVITHKQGTLSPALVARSGSVTAKSARLGIDAHKLLNGAVWQHRSRIAYITQTSLACLLKASVQKYC